MSAPPGIAPDTNGMLTDLSTPRPSKRAEAAARKVAADVDALADRQARLLDAECATREEFAEAEHMPRRRKLYATDTRIGAHNWPLVSR
jgi:hypothetical protein